MVRQMDIILSNSSGKPIYEQISDQVKSQILSGTLAEGDALPSMRLLAKELHISVITTKRAYEELERELKIRLREVEKQAVIQGAEAEKAIVKELPICYGGEFGPDLEECAALEHISTEELIRIHSSHEYYAYMLGFAPGHAYMARMEEPFHFKRRETPRVHIEARSVVVQENLSNLIPFEQPCGWNIIGRTPLTICDYSRADPFLVHPGEWVRFVPVSPEEYRKIEKADQMGTYRVKVYERAVREWE